MFGPQAFARSAESTPGSLKKAMDPHDDNQMSEQVIEQRVFDFLNNMYFGAQ